MVLYSESQGFCIILLRKFWVTLHYQNITNRDDIDFTNFTPAISDSAQEIHLEVIYH